jgi:hypothetical protein
VLTGVFSNEPVMAGFVATAGSRQENATKEQKTKHKPRL